MQKFTASLFVLLCGIAAFGLTISSARATVILNIDANGQLTGAHNVDVLGTLYDVTFVDGTCIALFNGCDELADFDFTDFTSALAAAQALLDQVFIDSALGLFDTAPEFTFGCGALFSKCSTLIPYAFETDGTPRCSVAANVWAGANANDRAATSRCPASQDTSLTTAANLAIFTSTVAVPEPSTLLIFGVGLAGMAGFGWRCRRGSAQTDRAGGVRG